MAKAKKITNLNMENLQSAEQLLNIATGNKAEGTAQPQISEEDVKVGGCMEVVQKGLNKPAEAATEATPETVLKLLASMTPEQRAQVGAFMGARNYGREKKTYHLHVMIRQSVAYKLERFAANNNRSKASVIEAALLEYIERRET